MEYEKIKNLLKNKKYNEALAECEQMISTDSSDVEIYKMRAQALSMLAQYSKELSDRKFILNSGEQTLKDYYLAGECALNCKEYELAESFFERLLEQGKIENNKWFESGGLLLLSFVQFKLKKFQDAMKNVSVVIELEPDCAMPVPGVSGLLSAKDLQDVLHKKMDF